VNRSEKKDFVEKLKEELNSSSSVIVAHYSGITVDEAEQLRKDMRDNGAKFKVTKNRLTKLALEDTQFKNIADLFTGPTAIAYSNDPVAPAKVAVNFEKKFENFKIIGGGFDGEKIDNTKINFLATLPSPCSCNDTASIPSLDVDVTLLVKTDGPLNSDNTSLFAPPVTLIASVSVL